MKIETIHEIIEYIEEHITEGISLNEIGKLVSYSPYYCSTSFRKQIGTSIKNYTRKRRLQLASEDLRETDMRIIDVALKYCYSSQEAFSRAFVNCFGMSPYEYRKLKLPILSYNSNFQLGKTDRKNQLINRSKTINTLQKIISDKYPVDILHVLNGTNMLDEYKNNGYLIEKSVYLPFNEAMCWGNVDGKIFSDTFIEQRVKSLKTTISEYKSIVIQPLEALLLNDFNTIVLWFGADMFCQINMLTILAYLDSINFPGDVLFA